MKNWIKKQVNIEIWRDFYDEQWRMKVIFMGWEIARYKVSYETSTFLAYEKTKPTLTPTRH